MFKHIIKRHGDRSWFGGYDARPARRVLLAAGVLGVAISVLWASAGGDMDFYQRKASDPAWLVKAGEFHGHLGPWLVVGAMIGDDALRRLDTRGCWLIDVTCSMPTDRHRPPFTCLLDGLQTSSGATMGKCNLHLVWEPKRWGEAWPAVSVSRLASSDKPAAGIVYKPRPALKEFLARMTPERLEELSRELAGKRVEDFFEVQPVVDPPTTTKASD